MSGQTPPVLTMVSPAEAAAALCARLSPVGTEAIGPSALAGRVLAAAATADRDSPPATVSAMDGYALRAADQPVDGGWLPVAGEVRIGEAPPALPPGAAVRVFTGGAVPAAADAVVPREHLHEEAADDRDRTGRVRWREDAPPSRVGRHVRHRGENARAGDAVLPAGVQATPAAVSALAAFGATPPVFRRVRVAVRVTGDELHDAATPADALPPFAIRDGNGPAISAFLAGLPWVETVSVERVPDSAAATADAVRSGLAEADAVILSGGVSMGDHDHVPAASVAAGCTAVYHRLAMRPGKPNFGAVGPAGQAVLGLPGNPVSVLAGLAVLALPVLRRLAGFTVSQPPRPSVAVAVAGSNPATLPMWAYRPAVLDADGRAHAVDHRGSGDTAGPAGMHGFFEVPPGERADAAPRRWFSG